MNFKDIWGNPVAPMYSVQSPADIIAAEQKASGGKWGQRKGNVTLGGMVPYGDGGVQYNNIWHGAPGMSEKQMLKNVHPSLVNAIEGSGQDFANVRGGVPYNFSYTMPGQTNPFFNTTIGNLK